MNRSVISIRTDERTSKRNGRSVTEGSDGANPTISVRSGVVDLSRRQHPHNQSQRYLVDYDVQRVSNKVQDQIERMFTDVIKDVTSCSFAVKCLGSLPLTDKVTSLLGLQEPLRQLYLSGAGHGVSSTHI